MLGRCASCPVGAGAPKLVFSDEGELSLAELSTPFLNLRWFLAVRGRKAGGRRAPVVPHVTRTYTCAGMPRRAQRMSGCVLAVGITAHLRVQRQRVGRPSSRARAPRSGYSADHLSRHRDDIRLGVKFIINII